MKILNVAIENFLGIGAANANMNRPGLTLVEGVNNDSASALSNGAGKSTLFEAVLWCLYGITRRGSKGDEVVNRHAKGGCRVDVVLELAGQTCNVARTRQWGADKLTTLTVHAAGDELTKGTVKDTQALLDGMLGMSALTFQKAAFFGQGDVKPFASLTDGELKAVFEQALGLTWYSEHKALVSGYISGLKQQIDHNETELRLLASSLELCNHKVEAQRQKIEAAEEAAKTWRQGRTAEADEHRRRIAEMVHEADAMRAESMTTSAAMGEKEAKLAELHALRDKLGAAIQARAEDAARNENETATHRRLAMELTKRMADIEAMAGTTCTTCLQPVGADGAKRVVGELHNKQAGAKELAEAAAAKLALARSKGDDLRQMAAQLDTKMAAVSDELGKGKSRLAAVAGRLMMVESELERGHKQVAQIEADLNNGDSGMAVIRQMTDDLNMLLADADVVKGRIAGMQAATAEARVSHADATILAEALGNAGVKSHVFDAVTPELNEWSNRYLQVLDPDLSVVISTVSKLKSGDYRERFSVSVECTTGGDSLNGFSGGEKQKVNLAVALGFNRLMRSMAAGDVPMLVLDEPFEALDAGSSDQVFELLKVIDADNLFLITHNESVRDLIPSRMVVEKKGGVATVRDVA